MAIGTHDFKPLPNSVRWIDRQVWLRERRRDTRRSLRRLKMSLVSLEAARHNRRPVGEVHLLVIPHDGPHTGLWSVANGNQFFEIYTSAVELLGADRVTLVEIANDSPPSVWQAQVLEAVSQTRATHIIGQIERDPNKTNSWSWDVIAAALNGRWDGVLIGQMYDAGFDWHRIRAQRLGRLLQNLVVADLCEPMGGYVKAGRPEVGPMTLPLSRATVEKIVQRIDGMTKIHDVTFVGALYDYRVELLDRLEESGFSVAVNPHRQDRARTDEASRSNQPSYLDYMATLASSEMTINFARASSGPRWQYKIRPQEASMVGCLCLTDDVDRTSRFFASDQFAHFSSVDSLDQVVRELLANRDALRSAQARAKARANELALIDYWGRLDDGLRRRGLPVITGLTAPAAPQR